MEIEQLYPGIISALIAALFLSIIKRKYNERQEFKHAADKFQDAFAEEMKFIDRFYAIDRAGKDISEILAKAADKHQDAFISFRKFLNKRDRKIIDNAWKEYVGGDKVMGKYTFHQYSTHGKFKDAENIRNRALVNIKNLLKIADLK